MSSSNNFASIPLPMLSFLFLVFTSFLPLPLPGQPFGGSMNLAPYSPYSSISPYSLGRYTMMNPYFCPFPTVMGGQQYPFYGKSSYNYVTPFGGYGISGYEGPPYGINTYWQPGVAYPSMLYGSVGQGYLGSMGYGNCRDRSADCALLASSGQCASSTSTRALCPLSCGLGCANDLYGGGANGMLNPFYRGIDGQSGSGQFGFPPTSLSPSAMPFVGQSGLQSDPIGATQFDAFGPDGFVAGNFGNFGAPFFCRDSHIFGCPNWAQHGFCQTVPEFMLNYCRASCGVCNGYGGGPLPLSQAVGGIVGNGLGLGGLGGDGIGNGFSGPFRDEPFSPQFSTDNFAAADPFSTSAQLLGGTSSPMFPYSPYYPLRASAASLGAITAERKEKEPRNGGAPKLMFNEDDVGQQLGGISEQQQLFAAGLAAGNNNLLGGLPSVSSSASFSPSSSQSQQSSLLNPSQMLPPSSLSTQHSSVSKLVRMDDLLLGEAKKKQRKSRR